MSGAPRAPVQPAEPSVKTPANRAQWFWRTLRFARKHGWDGPRRVALEQIAADPYAPEHFDGV
jgi:hypothetical protein